MNSEEGGETKSSIIFNDKFNYMAKIVPNIEYGSKDITMTSFNVSNSPIKTSKRKQKSNRTFLSPKKSVGWEMTQIS